MSHQPGRSTPPLQRSPWVFQVFLHSRSLYSLPGRHCQAGWSRDEPQRWSGGLGGQGPQSPFPSAPRGQWLMGELGLKESG